MADYLDHDQCWKHGTMPTVPNSELTEEQQRQGTWYRCDQEWCYSSGFVESAQYREVMASRMAKGLPDMAASHLSNLDAARNANYKSRGRYESLAVHSGAWLDSARSYLGADAVNSVLDAVRARREEAG